jgi:hypothetical protein
MHGTYLFLVEDDTTLAGKDAAKAAVETFNSYLDTYGDENNWSQELALLRKDGEVISLCEEGDWRGRDTWASSLLELPQEQRWDDMIKTAWRILGYDMRVNNVSSLGLVRGEKEEEFDLLSIDEIKELMLTQVPAGLAKAYAELVEKLSKPVDQPEKFDLDDYKRKKQVIVFEELLSAMGMDRLMGYNYVPFLSQTSPYTGWRTMCLSNDHSASHAILAVDIHT